jgi:hypothetical protein
MTMVRQDQYADDMDVTDDSGLLGDWRVVLTGCLAVLTAATVTLVSRTGDPTSADTYLTKATNASVVLSDGRIVDAVEGALVPPGATVRTGDCIAQPCGEAVLRTVDRDVYLGANSTLRVVDGVHQSLDKGLSMVDSRRGPRLDLQTPSGTVAVKDGALVRVELNPLYMRVGAFTGEARFGAAGRQTTFDLDALYQVQVPYVGVPRSATALRLTENDPWEDLLAHDLVAANRDLVQLAVGLDSTEGRVVLRTAPAALRVAPDVSGSTDIGEWALTAAVAGASARGGNPQARLAQVQDLRDGGGSWGVVAALVRSPVGAVGSLLDAWLRGDLVTNAAGGVPGGGVFGLPQPSASTDPGSRPRSPGPSKTPTKPPPTTPPPTSEPVDDLVGVVTGLTSATPSPSAVPPVSAVPTLPPLLPVPLLGG